MLLVGRGEREVPPDREAVGCHGLGEPQLIERGREGTGGVGEIVDAEGDVVEHRGESADEDLDVGPEIDEVVQEAVELLGELKVRAVV